MQNFHLTMRNGSEKQFEAKPAHPKTEFTKNINTEVPVSILLYIEGPW
jgi:hypothetical protein